MKTRTLNVEALARVEGEGGLTIRYRGGEVRSVELRLFEPPRFFEAFLRGRSYLEVPDLTARICGICPVAYQMSACRAMEDALGIRVDGSLRDLRRLLYFGEWIESHALHVFLLHAADFLGYSDALAMAGDRPELVRHGLRIKKAGNAIVRAVGGREIHPVNVRVGGFYRAPARSELNELLPELRWAREACRGLIRDMALFPFPDLERDWELVALRHPDDYAILDGRIASSAGLDLDAAQYDDHFLEEQVPYSNALHSTVRGRGAYLCGPLARFNLSYERLAPVAREAAEEAKIPVPCRNPFRSLLVRSVEILHSLDESIRTIDRYEPPAAPFLDAVPRAATGYACTEAPRGMLYHRYRIDSRGTIEDAKIVPPTSQNQKSIEQDLFAIAPRLLAEPRRDAIRLAEHVVRNHDPCISCATHFLDLRFEEENAGT